MCATRSSAVAETTRYFLSLNISLSHLRSFETTPLSRTCVIPYYYFIVTMSVSRTVSAIFSVMAFNWVTCYSRPLNTVPFESLRTVSYSHSIIHSNYGPILYYFRDKARYWSKIVICRAMLYKRGLCRHEVSVRPSVTFVYSVKTNKHIFKISSPSGSHTILVFTYKTLWKYSDRNFSNGGIECRLAMQKSRF